MKHPYEYALFVKCVRPISAVDSASFDLKNPKVEEALAKGLGEFAAKELPQAIETFPALTGWEVNSHSIAFCGDTVLVSVLIQRKRT